MNISLFILPFFSALLGWFVAWLLIRRVMNSAALHQRMIHQLQNYISNAMMNEQDIEKKLSDPALLKSSAPLIEKHVDDFLKIRLPKEMPVISQFIGERTIESLKSLFLKELEMLFPEMMKAFLIKAKNNKGHNDLPGVGLVNISPDKFRKMLSEILVPEFLKIQWFSAGVGFLFGVLEAAILLLAF